MTIDFRIALLSDDPHHLGLLKGYCYVHRYNIFEVAINKESLHAMAQIQPNLVILAMDLTQDRPPKIDFELIREMSFSLQIPVCYLRDINSASSLERNLACWIDAILDAPLDLNQLDDYLLSRFKHHHLFTQEKRNRARRAANDRRLLMLEQQNEAVCSKQLVYSIPKTNDADYFIVEPFQIDQRSKCVLLNGKSLNLTRKEFELFELLAKDVDRVFMSDEIINHVWPENNRVTKSDLYQYMHLLRKKVEIDPNNPQWILTVKGFGYKLDVSASTKENTPTFRKMKVVNNMAQ
jgi:DNA-binding response OmpR family regulator